ncbi:MAG: ATP-dependent helicase [Akkermansiaceae bacterium]|nr:ATP-dependent helicase [Akkermansiaceae bacterium]
MPGPLPGAPAVPDFAAELNDEQLAAVQTHARHALVIAGAGSGKTRTLTYRVAWLLSQGVPGWRVLLLTFTNKAAREMLERVGSLIGPESGSIWGGTFHSIANRILRRHAEMLGYRQGFTILDSDDQRALMRRLVKLHAGKQSKANPFPKPEVLLSLLSLAVNTGRTWEETLAADYPQLCKHEETIGQIYADYARRKVETNAMDFDDLLVNMVRLLSEHEEVRLHLQERFLHVLVDEYQDTNVLQERMISLLCGGSRTHLMVVGDDAQSIYSWRGARVDHIFDFSRRYPDAEVFKIETNYRSVPAILEISNAAIAQNERQFLKVLRPVRAANKWMPAVVPAPDNRTEAQFVARRIDELMGQGIPGKDIAVLYRAHFHSLDVQMELTRCHIPFRITSGLRFFEQAHVKDVVAYLRLLSNPRDEMAFRRIAATFPRVGEVSAGKMWQGWLAACEARLQSAPEVPLRGYEELMRGVSVPALARPNWQSFLATMEALRPEEGVELTPAEMVRLVQKELDAWFRSAYDNYDERWEDIEQLSRTLADMPSLEDFLSQVALLSEADREVEPDDDCVTLSTIHQAKGLEWKVVFVIFLGEGMFPHYRVINAGDARELEEETRLFYVAVTRAQDQLYLTYPRYNGHSYDSMYCPPSRFLTSLPQGLFEVWSE